MKPQKSSIIEINKPVFWQKPMIKFVLHFPLNFDTHVLKLLLIINKCKSHPSQKKLNLLHTIVTPSLQFKYTYFFFLLPNLFTNKVFIFFNIFSWSCILRRLEVFVYTWYIIELQPHIFFMWWWVLFFFCIELVFVIAN